MLIRGKTTGKYGHDKKKKKKQLAYESIKEYFMELPRDVHANEEGARFHYLMREQFDK